MKLYPKFAVTLVTDSNKNNIMTKAIKDSEVISNNIQDFKSGTFEVKFFKNLKKFKKFLKKLKTYQFIIYGVPTNSMKKGTIGLKYGSCDIARIKEDFTSPKTGYSLLVLDIEIVKGLEHLEHLKRDYTPKQIVKILKKAGLYSSLMITTSSSYSLFKKAKYHCFIVIDGNVKLETMKKVLIYRLGKLKMILKDANNTTQSSFCDINIYQPTRVFYEAQALNLDGDKVYKKRFYFYE